jgi:hypothetical protein
LTQGQSASSPAQYVTRDENDENKEQRDGMSQHDFHNILIIRVSMEATSKAWRLSLSSRKTSARGRRFSKVGYSSGATDARRCGDDGDASYDGGVLQRPGSLMRKA